MNIIKLNTKKINTTNVLRIERFRDVLNYICDNPKRSIKFTKYLRKDLTKIFGKQNTTFNTGRIFYIWILQFKKYTFEIWTNNERGTDIIIVTNANPNIYNDLLVEPKICIEFLKEFENLIE
jgi:hypothetical protein